jgi:hypothetical protein
MWCTFVWWVQLTGGSDDYRHVTRQLPATVQLLTYYWSRQRCHRDTAHWWFSFSPVHIADLFYLFTFSFIFVFSLSLSFLFLSFLSLFPFSVFLSLYSSPPLYLCQDSHRNMESVTYSKTHTEERIVSVSISVLAESKITVALMPSPPTTYKRNPGWKFSQLSLLNFPIHLVSSNTIYPPRFKPWPTLLFFGACGCLNCLPFLFKTPHVPGHRHLKSAQSNYDFTF